MSSRHTPPLIGNTSSLQRDTWMSSRHTPPLIGNTSSLQRDTWMSSSHTPPLIGNTPQHTFPTSKSIPPVTRKYHQLHSTTSDTPPITWENLFPTVGKVMATSQSQRVAILYSQVMATSQSQRVREGIFPGVLIDNNGVESSDTPRNILSQENRDDSLELGCRNPPMGDREAALRRILIGN